MTGGKWPQCDDPGQPAGGKAPNLLANESIGDAAGQNIVSTGGVGPRRNAIAARAHHDDTTTANFGVIDDVVTLIAHRRVRVVKLERLETVSVVAQVGEQVAVNVGKIDLGHWCLPLIANKDC